MVPVRISLLLFLLATCSLFSAEDGVFVRFRMLQPGEGHYYVRVGGFVHVANWYLPEAIVPSGALKKPNLRVTAGEFTEWFDLKAYAGKSLHKRHNRAGGVAEFPNITAKFIADSPSTNREVEIELATAADPSAVAKKWRETFEGDLTSFLVSPDLRADASQLESAAEMTERRMDWAMDATGGQRHSPTNLILQTSFWGPQRPELNRKEAKIVSLLGFNVVGNLQEALRASFPELRTPAASHDVPLGPNVDSNDVHKAWEKLGKRAKGDGLQAGAPYNFQDEVCCRPPIGKNEKALTFFRSWLKEQKITPSSLGVSSLDDVQPIETPEAFRERARNGEAAARRVFYYSSRYRQIAATDRFLWNSAELHRIAGTSVVSSTLLADHPYFGGTGLGMGFEQQNNTWGGWPLAMDWFDIGRRRAVDLIGVEDWMGLQFMYGPNSTWEGFQLMGFQSAIFRSASRGQMPIIAWITPSDERNLRLKAASALAQGAKNFFYWTYGPTATSTENYWSDQRGSYPGMAHLSRLLEAGEPVLATGLPRKTRVALLYSLSSDLWQPYGYIHMLERRGLYLALVHEQYLVDFLTEEDVASGRLKEHRILYTADPCISTSSARAIENWVPQGGTIVATCNAGSQNEFGEPSDALKKLFGISSVVSVERQEGDYRTRGKLNSISHLDHIAVGQGSLGVIGLRCSVQPATAKVQGTFSSNGAPAVLQNKFGRGKAVWVGATPGVSYIKNAKFVPNALAEKWPRADREFLTHYAMESGSQPLLTLSQPVIEAGIYDHPSGTALVLANFTYDPIQHLTVELPTSRKVTAVSSVEHGELRFETSPAPKPWRSDGFRQMVRFEVPLGFDDLILLK